MRRVRSLRRQEEPRETSYFVLLKVCVGILARCHCTMLKTSTCSAFCSTQ
ncbi:hypothetical protein HMPREF1580_01066 [Gardnerella vaginalis JCP8070]|uniref:Uncharacterized protein n=1 Tax=Gardnerella pickettii JCP7719 TaxID=1261061 RepID=S4GMA7_9BIFI|nr:hypothetical protein HMPREF1576_00898 [Gardnerella pickettii JCP7719]EPI59136.1 hypothetical protein HMPREF1580_01066 [Gardnerella vaginalis JCP8070]